MELASESARFLLRSATCPQLPLEHCGGTLYHIPASIWPQVTMKMLAPKTMAVRRMSQLRFADPPPAPTRRVVVTGLGAVTPFGVGVDRAWNALLGSQSAVKVSIYLPVLLLRAHRTRELIRLVCSVSLDGKTARSHARSERRCLAAATTRTPSARKTGSIPRVRAARKSTLSRLLSLPVRI